MAVAITGLASTALGDGNPADSLSQQEKPIFEYSFNLQPSMQFEGKYSIVDRNTGNIIGSSLWDDVRRRFTLFDAKGKYAGFIQASMTEPQAPKIYKQYLAYDHNNNYQGVIIKDVGGMPLSPTALPPLSGAIGEPQPRPLGNELRGQWQFFRIGNVAIEDVPEVEPKILPWYVEEILDENQ
ncbi:MAG: hypothetical protein HY913_21760 [Desulfomonile tiedjei]|nr:hypothetical protein [Desulfomonile tiedjei]